MPATWPQTGQPTSTPNVPQSLGFAVVVVVVVVVELEA
jgi:hypothetical protein